MDYKTKTYERRLSTSREVNAMHTYLIKLGFEQLTGTEESTARSFGSQDLGTVVMEQSLHNRILQVAIGTSNDEFLKEFTERFELK